MGLFEVLDALELEVDILLDLEERELEVEVLFEAHHLALLSGAVMVDHALHVVRGRLELVDAEVELQDVGIGGDVAVRVGERDPCVRRARGTAHKIMPCHRSALRAPGAHGRGGQAASSHTQGRSCSSGPRSRSATFRVRGPG
tara:strand:+ start:692 stop:1120 length:429 start_codon:yes stop_codon:yes gene_type:complete